MTRDVQRSTPRIGRPNPDRAEALDRLRDGATASEVARWAGVHRATATRWARAAGTDPGTNTTRTAAATAARAAKLTATTLDRLEYIVDLASTGLIRRLEANADAAELDDADLGEWSTEFGRFIPPEHRVAASAAMRRYLHVAALESNRDLSAAVSRAVQALAVLREKSGAGGTIVVQFGIPRPKEPDNIVQDVVVDPYSV
ncbi:MAG: hypothetical protein ACR2KL_07270 [Nocardioidaceae bacterium]